MEVIDLEKRVPLKFYFHELYDNEYLNYNDMLVNVHKDLIEPVDYIKVGDFNEELVGLTVKKATEFLNEIPEVNEFSFTFYRVDASRRYIL